ncbi:hypothetical protein GCM10023259_014280 [Thermocatellispora tengchongensis]
MISVRGGLLLTLVVAVLSASGCAGTGGDRPFVPGGGGASEVAASSAAPTPAGPRTETIAIGRAAKVLVEWPAALDPAQTEMIETYRDFYVDKWRAVVTRGRDQGYLEAMELEAAQGSAAWVKEFLDQRRSVRGTAKLYAMAVTSVTGETAAQVNVCVDESGLRLTDARTGDVLPAQPAWTRPPRSTYLQGAVVHRGDDGVWRIKALRYAVHPDERAKGCQR